MRYCFPKFVHGEKWPIFISQKCYVAIELKFQFIFYMKGRYNACVIHHIWIPYSNGFMLKKIFQIYVFCVFIKAIDYNTISNIIAGLTNYSISSNKVI